MSEYWHLIRDGRMDPAMNMAMDEALLESASAIGKPILRLYGWSRPAATFGYFQKYATVAALTRLRPLLRRPTGGGLVPHDADWTYSLTFPPDHFWYSLKAVESYRRLHQWIRASFSTLSIPTQLAPEGGADKNPQCFTGAEKHDLVYRDQKIAGAAQRRNRLGLLIQGSIQSVPKIVSRADWETVFLHRHEFRECREWRAFEIADSFRERVNELIEDKYASRQYNERR